jgi:hypothetical protein
MSYKAIPKQCDTEQDVQTRLYHNHNDIIQSRQLVFQHGILRIYLDSTYALATGAQNGVIQPALFTWPCAHAIAKILCANPSLVRDRHVLELGAGTCLAGMVAASVGAHQVVLSDQTKDPALFDDWQRACVANIALNGQTECCRVKGIEWGDMSNEVIRAGNFDVLLGADLVYQADGHNDSDTEEMLLALFTTVAAAFCCSGPHVFMIMAVQDRDTGHMLLAHEVAHHCGLRVSDWRSTGSSDSGQEGVRIVRVDRGRS